ncbi:MAG: DUF5666 domain-containing protein [Candidatus Dadabacteria bacterium]|nr:DUF5666 domain-containing protein [Candidatus Dadabacteria bacterium]
MKDSWTALAVVLVMLGLIACSGGDTGNTGISNTARPTEQTDTGLRTTASSYEIEGAITSIVNSQSFFLGNTLIVHDSSTRFEYGNADNLAVGRRVEVEGSKITPGTATAQEIEFKDRNYDDDYEDYYEIEGAITSIVDSRSFFLGNILITHDFSTRFEYGNANDLAVGRRVEVEGSRISSGAITAREIEFEDGDYDDDNNHNNEIEGTITSIVDSQSFLLGDILVRHDSSTRFEYGNANDLAVGRRVEVEGSRISSGAITAREIEFEYTDYDDDDDHDDDNYYDDYYEIEGRITSIVDSQSFFLGSTLVIHDSSTRFEYGNANNLAVGRRVEVEGSRTTSGTIIAREIEFEDREYDDDYYYNNGNDDEDYYDDYYEIEGRITSIVDSQSFLLGSTLVIHNSSTRFEYGNANNLAVGRRVEVEGSRTSSGIVIAREIEFEDD